MKINNNLIKVVILMLLINDFVFTLEMKSKSKAKTNSNLQLRIAALEKEYDNDIDSFSDIENENTQSRSENDLIEIKDENSENGSNNNINTNFLEINNKNDHPFGKMKILNLNNIDKKSSTNYSFEKKTEESELKVKAEKKIAAENKTANILQSKKTFNTSINEKIRGSFKKFRTIPRNTSDDFMLFLNYLGNASKRAIEKSSKLSNDIKNGYKYESNDFTK